MKPLEFNMSRVESSSAPVDFRDRSSIGEEFKGTDDEESSEGVSSDSQQEMPPEEPLIPQH